MQRASLVELVCRGYSTRRLAKELSTSQTNIRYWLGKYDLRTDESSKAPSGRKCPCGETRSIMFYARMKAICIACHNKYTVARQQRNKAWAVAQSGGCCKLCGYDRCLAALDFHHLDPTTKDSGLEAGIRRSWGKPRILAEISKCLLVCRNCHSEIHAGLVDVAQWTAQLPPKKQVVSSNLTVDTNFICEALG